MKKSILISFLMFYMGFQALATHQRAAEITYKHISGLTYEARIITYTYTPSPADRPELTLNWGDGTSSTLLRTQKTNLPNNISLNIYEYNPGMGAVSNRHTYSSPGNYLLWMEDPNRNYGVVNIPNSVNVPMYVQSEIIINPFLGYDNSPVLLNPPVDVGCVGQTFIHNPGAYDIDGDSLSYRLVDCKTSGGIDIPGYSFPQASNDFYINAITGDVIWDAPVLQGEYNIAFVIEEWRSGVLIGNVTRDMQIEIVSCTNQPPVITTINDTCIKAGDELVFQTIAIDPDTVNLSATGGPFEVGNSPATINPNPAAGNDTVNTTFSWATNCSHVQKQAYQVFFKAIDYSKPVNLVAYKTVSITIVSPPPENLGSEAVGNTIHLKWDRIICTKAKGYRIYRRNGYYGFIPGHCETGVPAYTGYRLIKETENIQDTTFIDDEFGQGLIQGIDYCYMVTAWFQDGAESYASLESCATLKRDVPVITNVSNDSTDLSVGQGFIAWSKPTELDTIQTPGPYQYIVYRAENQNGANSQAVSTIPGLDDTTFVDQGINMNTSGTPYSYKIGLESLTFGPIGNSQTASSIFLQSLSTDQEIQLSFNPQVPWQNDYFVIYRKMPDSMQFDSIGFSNQNLYRDTLLTNGKQYCYYVKSVGKYSANGFVDPIINFSQILCAVPVDNKPPCAPTLTVTTNCDLASNILTWNNPNHSCADDVAKYYIYFSPIEGQDLILLDSVSPASDTTYVHYNQGNINGCYSVTAIDSVGNQSVYSDSVCVSFEACSIYSIPNVFTPNHDGYNDLLKPYPYTSVEKIDIKIFNRWGNMVFETSDPDINWDGKNMKNKADCAQGTYFYVCDIYEITLLGTRQRTIHGGVTIIR